MTVIKGFTPVPDPLDMTTFKQLTDPTAHERFVEKMATLTPEQQEKARKLLAIKKIDKETEALAESAEARFEERWHVAGGWNVDLPPAETPPVEDDVPFVDPWESND